MRGEQERAHFGDRGADRVALLAEQIPEHGRGGAPGVVGSRPSLAARASSFGLGVPGMAMPARSPLTSAQKTGTPALEKASASDLERDCLAGAGGAGDEAVAVGGGQVKQAGRVAAGEQDVGHVGASWRIDMADCGAVGEGAGQKF